MTFFYHGTSSVVVRRLQEGEALHSPYLAADTDLAYYYAEEQAEEDEGEPVILLVTIPDESLLRYDGAAMDEPVMVTEREYETKVDHAASLHPEWMANGYFCPPAEAWDISWEIVKSAWYDGDVTDWTETD